jgi:hypothetical protein
VTVPDLTRWIELETAQPRARNNLRASWVTFFRWARTARALPKTEQTEAELVQRWRVERKAIAIYTPEELAALLDHARTREAWEMVALPTLSRLCGVRRHEVTGEQTNHQGLTWAEILFEEDMVRVGVQKIRTKVDRLTLLCPAAKQWLRLCPQKAEESVCALGNAGNVLIRLAKVAGVNLKGNGLRKSYITYRMAMVQNAHQVADECGNSPEEINAS